MIVLDSMSTWIMLFSMKIGLFGKGKMGTVVTRLAKEKGYHLVNPVDADVCIDFSHSDVVLDHVRWSVDHQTPLIIGTTGWDEQIEIARSLVEKSQTAALFSPNFSLSVAYFKQLLIFARKLLSDYSVAGVEFHHNQKQDAPSGTAKEIAAALHMPAPFASVRCGNIPGIHEVLFNSPYDTIRLIHEAHNRDSFAAGAIFAASWIKGKIGWYTLDDMLGDLHSAHHTL